MRWIIGDRAVQERGASTSQMGRFETVAMTEECNLRALAALSGQGLEVPSRELRKVLPGKRGRCSLSLVSPTSSPNLGDEGIR